MLLAGITFAANIDPSGNDSQYAWGENVGWINFDPNEGPGVTVSGDKLLGYVWAENIGWINLSCENSGYCATVDYGVTNDGDGNLAGYAWGENVGWISFSCENTVGCATAHYRVTIDSAGNFSGHAWGENIGWINFGLGDNAVVACKVNFIDLSNFADDWLETGLGLSADLSGDNDVDFNDYAEFAQYWHDFCPAAWPLK